MLSLSLAKIASCGLITLCLSSAPVVGHAQDIAALDKKNGFRGMEFGAKFQDVPGLVLPSDIAGVGTVYSRLEENKRVGEVELNYIGYGFCSGRLASIVLLAKGRDNAIRLLNSLTLAYGPSINSLTDWAEWEGKRVHMTYTADEAGNASVLITSTVIKQECARQAKSDF